MLRRWQRSAPRQHGRHRRLTRARDAPPSGRGDARLRDQHCRKVDDRRWGTGLTPSIVAESSSPQRLRFGRRRLAISGFGRFALHQLELGPVAARRPEDLVSHSLSYRRRQELTRSVRRIGCCAGIGIVASRKRPKRSDGYASNAQIWLRSSAILASTIIL